MDYNNVKKAGIIHKIVCHEVKPRIKHNATYLSIAEFVENRVKELLNDPSGSSGMAFPCGISVNDCVAHDTPSKNDPRVFVNGDVVKIDFGVHVKGSIVDAAFTSIVGDPLSIEDSNAVNASKAALKMAISKAKPGCHLLELGKSIQIFVENFVENYAENDNGVKPPPKPPKPPKVVWDICGHQIGLWRVHLPGGKAVPNVGNVWNPDPSHPSNAKGYDYKMEAGEYYAIEVYTSTGAGRALPKDGYTYKDVSHFEFYQDPRHGPLKQYKTLPFCRRWLDSNQSIKLRKAISTKKVEMSPELYDSPGSRVAQFEHTIYITADGCQVMA
uniref:Peptidase M24 domain-containing protein n=1 Tax=viral metagenome TaxID=1070528 RepID=A0A6C0CK54_9ZZZZ